jgi:hypothetical protein
MAAHKSENYFQTAGGLLHGACEQSDARKTKKTHQHFGEMHGSPKI